MPPLPKAARAFRLREATDHDAQAIRELQSSIYLEDTAFVGDGPATEGMLARRIRSLLPEHSLYLVAEQEQSLCGWLELHKLNAKKLNHVATMTLAVHPDYRQQGIASNLLDEALAWLKKHAVYKIAINVRASNQAALKQYERYQFKIEGRELNQIKLKNGFEDNLIMAKFIMD